MLDALPGIASACQNHFMLLLDFLSYPYIAAFRSKTTGFLSVSSWIPMRPGFRSRERRKTNGNRARPAAAHFESAFTLTAGNGRF
jgi:hypothetical protein